jgi:hypothetical protein
MTSSGGCMISGEDGSTEGDRDNNQHQEFFVVLDTLEDDKAVINDSNAVSADVISVGGVNLVERESF